MLTVYSPYSIVGYAQRTELGDPDFTDLESKIQSFLSKDTAGLIRANISDAHTFPVEYYNPHWGPIDNHGTTHMSTVDQQNMAVALTSTVNLVFGSKLLDPKTGIVLNDEMDDFSIPGTPNAFGLQPSPFNYPEPGKRPLSSCVPTIVERDGQFELSLGGSGGSRILTSVLQVSFFLQALFSFFSCMVCCEGQIAYCILYFLCFIL